MIAIKIGYARVSTTGQDLTAQRTALTALGVEADRVYVDHGLTGTNRARPGLREALAACRAGDTLVVTKLDRLARSLPDARDIVDELTTGGVKLALGGSVHDPTDPVGRLLFNVLAMVAEFKSDLIKMRTREGLAVARAAGKLRGRKPKLTARQEEHLVGLYRAGETSTADLAALFGVGRSTVYRAIDRAGARCDKAPVPVASARSLERIDLMTEKTPVECALIERDLAAEAARLRQEVARLDQEVTQLRHALGHRPLTERVVGMIMLAAGCEQTAWTMLSKASQDTNRKVRDLAGLISAQVAAGHGLPSDLRAVPPPRVSALRQLTGDLQAPPPPS